MRDRLIALIVAGLQAALCQFFDFCINHEDCPDGVCDDATVSIDKLGDERPGVAIGPGRVQSPSFNFQWDRLSQVAAAAKAFVDELRAFLGLTRVGG